MVREQEQAEAITEEEMTGMVLPGTSSVNVPQQGRNAFTELMSPKHKPDTKRYQKDIDPFKPGVFAGRRGLGAYTADPTVWPPSRVFYYDDQTVFINDMYPKSSVHTLVLPRSPRNELHPFDAFEDADFLAEVKAETEKAKAMVANELRRRFGRFSKTDRPRIAAMESDDPPEVLPPGRDWSKDVITGIHAGPSMYHLHVHVMSRDMVNDCLKSRGHYQSFTTPFLVRLDEFPLPPDDIRRNPDRGGYLHAESHCWRCGKNFGDRMSKLKAHLKEEFEEWIRE